MSFAWRAGDSGVNHCDKNLLAVRPVIARVAAPGLLDFLCITFNVGARQILKQHIKSGPEEIFPSLREMFF